MTTAGTCANARSVTRTWTATDACGNSATASQTVNVVDTTKPTISALPAVTTIECPATPVFATPTATDACGTATLTFADVTTAGACANAQSVTRTWTATDGCGNSATASQMIHVVDTTAPTIVCAAAKAVECGSNWTFDNPTASDICGSATISIFSTITNRPGQLGNSFDATRTWRATDDCGNTSDCSQLVTVMDTIAPFITCPANISLITTNPAGTAVSFTVPAADICSGSVTPVCTPSSGAVFTVGTRTVNCTATDASLNPSSCSFTVTVVLNHVPVAGDNVLWVLQDHPRAITIEKLLSNDSDLDGDTLTLTAVSATSTNGGVVTRSSTEVFYTPVASFLGTDLFTYTVSDGRGGVATASVVVHVVSRNDASFNRIVDVTLTSTGLKFHFAGIPGFGYSVERSTNLTSWSSIGSFTAPAAGTADFEDTHPPASAAFYRTVLVE